MSLKQKKLYIPFPEKKNVGGPFTFLRNLKNYFNLQKYNYEKKISYKCSGIFFVVSTKLKKLKNFRKAKLPIIQRLDGVYYYSQHGEKFERLNKKIKEIYHSYSTHIIFQSNYSLMQCTEVLGALPHENYSIICNGVNKSTFYSNDQYKEKNYKEFKFITTGSFRKRVMLEPIVNALDSLRNDCCFKWMVVGSVEEENIKEYLNRDYIDYIPPVASQDALADLLRKADIYLHSQLNDNCPNSVLEAISCGLPVVGFDSGSMSELCFFNKELLAYVSDEVIQKYEDFDYKKLAEKIKLCINDFFEYRRIALENSGMYDFEECGKEYVKVFEDELKKVKWLQKMFFNYLLSKDLLIDIMKKIVKKILNKVVYLGLLSLLKLPLDKLLESLYFVINQKAKELSASDSLKFLFNIENKLYSYQSRESVRYGDGLHTKHKHTKYHDFFIKNTEENSEVIDIGCGNGSLAFDIANSVKGVNVYGIDIAENNIAIAKSKYLAGNITYVCGNALKDLPIQEFDIVVLSNVLEHIEYRVSFLKTILSKYSPKKILIRVPVFERDWRVPLKKELGMDYRLDKTHHIEYSNAEFISEISDAGLKIESCKINWGEIWAVCISREKV